METIKGEAEDIIYRNEENGYTVLQMNIEGLPVTATGIMPVLSEGEYIEAEGEYKNNAKYGYQFEVKKVRTTLPDTTEGIRRYLAGGIIKGVGEATAELIVRKFGKDSLKVIEKTPNELSKIKGISKKKAEDIHGQYVENADSRNAVMFLQGYGMSLNLSMKIYQKYGKKTESELMKNPYKLVEDIDGIGFLTADRIAKTLGIKENDPFRIKAGIVYALKEASEKNGHTCLPRGELISKVTALLGIQENRDGFFDALEDLVINGNIRIRDQKAEKDRQNEKADGATSANDAPLTSRRPFTCGPLSVAAGNIYDGVFESGPSENEYKEDSKAVMLTKFYTIEKGIAGKLIKLISAADENGLGTDAEIREFEAANGIEFHPAQAEAIKESLGNGVYVITGGPGTGKTTIIKCILRILEKHGHTVALLAPTGRAAKRMSEAVGVEAKTIHRALLSEGGDGERQRFGRNESNPLEATFFIVDEVSMVDAGLMHNLLKAVRPGSRMLLVGDKDQLPSVGAGNVLSDIMNSGLIKTGFLTHIYRQAAKSRIITNAHNINGGKMPVLDDKSETSDFFFLERGTPDEIYGAALSMISDRLPKFSRVEPIKIQILAPMKNGAAGVHALNRGVQNLLNPPGGAKSEIALGGDVFRCGDKVMQTSNNYDLEWYRSLGARAERGPGVFNGDIGIIKAMNAPARALTVEFEDGRTAEYPPENLEELTLAYAVTVHKSQGCEFDVVILPIAAGSGLIMTRNLLYTAVTRAKKLVMMIGSKYNIERMVKNDYSEKRYSMLSEFFREAAAELI